MITDEELNEELNEATFVAHRGLANPLSAPLPLRDSARIIGWLRTFEEGGRLFVETRSDTGADGSTPALGAGGSRFDSEVSDFLTLGFVG